nr:hypothetical protein [Providencia stuartii]ELR5082463.1 hypothetical protein [Providencia stuartii]
MKEFIQAVINAYLNRKNEKTEIFLEDDDYPEHNELIKKINEINKLKRMLGIANPLFQKLIIWGVNCNKLTINLDKLKYFERYIKSNENGDLYLEQRDIKSANWLAIIFIVTTSIFFSASQMLMNIKWYVFSYGSLVVGFFMLFALISVALIPTKKDAKSMEKLIQEYNERNKESD